MANNLQDNIYRLMQFAEANRLDEHYDRAKVIQQVDRHTLMINEDIRVRYLQHKLPDVTRILIHLSVHGRSNVQFNEEFIEQLGQEFGFGPRSEWHIVMTDRPPTPSIHIFKIMPA